LSFPFSRDIVVVDIGYGVVDNTGGIGLVSESDIH
jgi:hypothetical protein